MTTAGAFLGGASGRLLPVSLPLRFFGAAAVYHLAAWLVLAASAAEWLAFPGGLGAPLAALHLLTLGVFGMTALGAAAQLLPVATRQAPVGQRALRLVWCCYTPGVALLAAGMHVAHPPLLAIGALAVALPLAAWAVLVVRHLLGARGMPGVRAHAWAALTCLVLLLASAVLLVAGWLGWTNASRTLLQPLHLLLGPFGFLGMLALGLSFILVPMFALSVPVPERAQLASCALLVAGLLLACAAVLLPGTPMLPALAWSAGTAGVLLHLHLMRRALATGMRKDLGRSFVLVKSGWAGLLCALALGGALWAGLPLPGGRAWLGLALVAWLLSMVLGFLERILPFLAALHAAAGKRRGPTPSSLTHERALRTHAACHFGALALLAAAIATGSAWLALGGALCGVAGACAFAVFTLHVSRRLRAALS